MTARTTAACVKPMLSPKASSVPPSRPKRPNAAMKADPGDSRRQHERELDQRDHEPATWEPTRRDEVGGRGADEQDDRLRDEVRLDRDDEGVHGRAAPELREELARRDPREDGDDRQQQERENDREREEENTAEEAPRQPVRGASLGGATLQVAMIVPMHRLVGCSQQLITRCVNSDPLRGPRDGGSSDWRAGGRASARSSRTSP